jgi:hypothetical protein
LGAINDIIFVTATTGAAAYYIGGTTMHKDFKISIQDNPVHDKLSDTPKQKRMRKLFKTIALMKDV